MGGFQPESASPCTTLELIREELKWGGLSDQSVQKMAELMARFTIYAEKGHGLRSVAEIAEDHVAGFVFAPSMAGSERRRPSVATMHLRRSALRLYFRTSRQLGVCPGEPTLDLVLPTRSSLHMRLTFGDVELACPLNRLASESRAQSEDSDKVAMVEEWWPDP